ncbi:MAG: diphosphomevalonate decarboxylase [Pseudomonadota bacterium]
MNNINRTIKVSTPSNIAFVKYWGKKPVQYPLNPSVSMTLKNCVCEMDISYQSVENGSFINNFLFNDQKNEKFLKRLEKYLNSLKEICPYLENLSFSIKTNMTFPHSAGIASSAAAFGALGYALANIEREIDLISLEEVNQRASFLARLGSGSAARSIEGPYCIWGDHHQIKSHDDYALKFTNIHSSFKDVKDVILIIDQNEKSISSSEGHQLMNDHIFKETRIHQANQNFIDIISSMRSGDWEQFGGILENEALTLHAMMMTSQPSYMLLKPNSLQVIQKIQQFREENALPIYYTIDAGPNIHIIYPKNYENDAENFIKTELSEYCENGRYIIDHCGTGACLTD